MVAHQALNSDAQSLIDEDPFAGTEYRALSLIGSGGMGDVYLVQHRVLEKTQAAKLLRATHATDRRIVDRIRLEAHALAKLRHPNVVQIHEFALTPAGLPFIVMQLLRGRTLKDELIEKGRIPLNYALMYTMHLLGGLEAVHQLGIVHRDIKPSNLFLHTDDAGEVTLKMLDFGVARVIPGVHEDAPQPLIHPTRTGTVVGTPIFVSPEAALGRPVDVRTDIYNAAIMLYVMLTGRGPFDHLHTNEAIVEAHAYAEPPAPAKHSKHWLGPLIDDVVLRGLRKDPKDRYQNAGEFAQAIYELMDACMRASQEQGERKQPLSAPRLAPETTERNSASVHESHSISRLERASLPSRILAVSRGHLSALISKRTAAFILAVLLSALAMRLLVQWGVR